MSAIKLDFNQKKKTLSTVTFTDTPEQSAISPTKSGTGAKNLSKTLKPSINQIESKETSFLEQSRLVTQRIARTIRNEAQIILLFLMMNGLKIMTYRNFSVNGKNCKFFLPELVTSMLLNPKFVEGEEILLRILFKNKNKAIWKMLNERKIAQLNIWEAEVKEIDRKVFSAKVKKHF